MSDHASGTARGERAFTLIELLVVVAIIALLISILLPSLSRARAQARTTQCLSRVAQMAKAFLLYADDYDETPPFVSTMHYYPSAPDNDVPDPNETWLVDCVSTTDSPAAARAAMRNIAYESQEEWTTDVPKSGTLFTYTRFESLYRCPEFERITDPMKTHNAFNYTRAVWARLYRLQREMELLGEEADEWGDVQGPIMKPSKIHSTAELPMVIGEQWNRHCAINGEYGTGPQHSPYVCNDYGFFLHNIMAVAHGAPVASKLHPFDTLPGMPNFLWPQAGIGFYDGHAALMRDPWPTFEQGDNKRSANPSEFPWRFGGAGPQWYSEYQAATNFVVALCFWQRGFDPYQKFQGYVQPPF
ncbi:MAG: prepilin-type N-terminal cleavage/methylation domain-containing protein [Phycisphaerae bacterium]|nr:prepilin-type N-terminal cleavage/methylation domain-containing protein [Phycisphaerae bacterium]